MKRMWKIRLALYLICLPLMLVYPVKKILDLERPVSPPVAVTVPACYFWGGVPLPENVDLPRGWAVLDCPDGNFKAISRVVRCRRKVAPGEIALPARIRYPFAELFTLCRPDISVEEYKILIYPSGDWVFAPLPVEQ